jgi:tetratricopeptide (TPR) repeat protein
LAGGEVLATLRRARGLLERKGELDSAIAEYRLGLQLDPQDANRRSSLGVLLIKNGDLDSAIEELRLALHYGHEIPSAHYQLGGALEKKGDMDATLKEYKKAATGGAEHSGIQGSNG